MKISQTNGIAEWHWGTSNNLPEGWCKIRLGVVCSVQGGFAFKSRDYQETGLPLIRISNLVAGSVELVDDTPYLPEYYLDQFSEYVLRQGDVLIALSGATTGKLAVFQLQEKAVLNQRVGRFRWVSEKLIDKHFFTFFLDMLSHYILIEAYGGAQPNISPTRIEQMATILPPLAEQKRIVAKVDQLLARVNAARERLTRVAAILAGAEKHVAAATAQTDKLTQAILAKAFRGELVPTEAELALREGRSYEPASALLAKIEAQRNHVRPQRKRRSSWQQKSS